MSTTAEAPSDAPQSPPDADERLAGSHRLARVLRRPEVGAAVAALVIFIFFSVTTDAFLTPGGVSTWLFTASSFGIMAVAVALLMIGGDMSGAAVAAVESTGSTAKIGTFDVNADVVQNIIDGKIVFAIDQQPYVQGYLGVVGIYLKLTNGNDIGGGEPIYSGPAIINKDNAESVLQYAKNGTR